jgi:hypothetical protein
MLRRPGAQFRERNFECIIENLEWRIGGRGLGVRHVHLKAFRFSISRKTNFPIHNFTLSIFHFTFAYIQSVAAPNACQSLTIVALARGEKSNCSSVPMRVCTNPRSKSSAVIVRSVFVEVIPGVANVELLPVPMLPVPIEIGDWDWQHWTLATFEDVATVPCSGGWAMMRKD